MAPQGRKKTKVLMQQQQSFKVLDYPFCKRGEDAI
jgi:hypothetical protein